jgi:hypothetical protein
VSCPPAAHQQIGAASAPATEVSKKRRRSIEPPRHARPALALEPDHVAFDAAVQLAAPAVLGVEGVQLGQQGHGDALTRRRQRSSATAQPFCFTFNQRLVTPLSYALASSLAT